MLQMSLKALGRFTTVLPCIILSFSSVWGRPLAHDDRFSLEVRRLEERQDVSSSSSFSDPSSINASRIVVAATSGEPPLQTGDFFNSISGSQGPSPAFPTQTSTSPFTSNTSNNDLSTPFAASASQSPTVSVSALPVPSRVSARRGPLQTSTFIIVACTGGGIILFLLIFAWYSICWKKRRRHIREVEKGRISRPFGTGPGEDQPPPAPKHPYPFRTAALSSRNAVPPATPSRLQISPQLAGTLSPSSPLPSSVSPGGIEQQALLEELHVLKERIKKVEALARSGSATGSGYSGTASPSDTTPSSRPRDSEPPPDYHDRNGVTLQSRPVEERKRRK